VCVDRSDWPGPNRIDTVRGVKSDILNGRERLVFRTWGRGPGMRWYALDYNIPSGLHRPARGSQTEIQAVRRAPEGRASESDQSRDSDAERVLAHRRGAVARGLTTHGFAHAPLLIRMPRIWEFVNAPMAVWGCFLGATLDVTRR
jgi:hypothetical protein